MDLIAGLSVMGGPEFLDSVSSSDWLPFVVG